MKTLVYFLAAFALFSSNAFAQQPTITITNSTACDMQVSVSATEHEDVACIQCSDNVCVPAGSIGASAVQLTLPVAAAQALIL